MEESVTIWTIGHSTRPIDEFIALLKQNGTAMLADVRRFPGSRRHPQFGSEALSQTLNAAGIQYAAFPDLGGRRPPNPNSTNTAWRNASFRGYADYCETADFRDAMARLITIARREPTTIMCAEALWWRCHRAIIADQLMAAGHEVRHIASDGATHQHRYTSAAQLIDGRISYAGEASLGL